MHPLLRVWAISAALIAVLLLLRGAFALAVACFLFSPAPVLLFSHGNSDQRHLSSYWLRAVGIGVVALVILFVVVVYFGGVPPVHEWRGALSGASR
jgi:uncharacterized BrkB/YihY/UPF0761 family membrane protein